MTNSTVHDFETMFDHPPVVTACAPGRVNLIGEHTDYNGGFVLPMAIPQRTRVELAVRGDDLVRVSSMNLGCNARATYVLGAENKANEWYDYVQGVTRALRETGQEIRGFDVRFDSSVPIGSGLSSSAALEVALLRSLRRAFDLHLGDVELALLAQRAENDLVGVPVGIMDPMAASLGDERTALFLDTRTLEVERVALPEGLEILVLDSGVEHSHAKGDYRTRRAECEAAAAALGVHQLRDVIDLDRVARLPSPLDRRARHVVTENTRVLAAVVALRAGGLVALGELFAQSQASMRDDFEISVPEVDRLVERAAREPAVFGARMTGGGFGGAVVVLVKAGHAAEVGGRIAAEMPGARLLVPEARG